MRTEAILGLGKIYRDSMRMMATMNNLEVWYSRVEIEPIVDIMQTQAADREPRPT